MVVIYALVCPQTKQIRYIGKTNRSLKARLNGHIQEARRSSTSHKKRWIRLLLSSALMPSLVVLEEVPEGVKWQDRERHWIGHARENGWPLTNQTAGGEGLDFIDPVAKKAYLDNLSASLRRIHAANPERAAAMMAGNKASWAADREGRIAACQAGWTESSKKQLAESMAKVRARDGFKEQQERRAKDLWRDHRDTFMAAFATPEIKAKHSARAKRCWSDPDTRTRMMNRWTPDARARQADAIRNRGPEYRAAMAEKKRLYWLNLSPDERVKKTQAMRDAKTRNRNESNTD